MHLLAAQSGVIDGGAEAIDLGQTPGDIVVISAADSELASLAHAHDRLPEPKPSLRLANLMALGHNLSVDTYVERTLEQAQFIAVRLLGGEAYWPYGVERLTALARSAGSRWRCCPAARSPIRTWSGAAVSRRVRWSACGPISRTAGRRTPAASCAWPHSSSAGAKRRRRRKPSPGRVSTGPASGSRRWRRFGRNGRRTARSRPSRSIARSSKAG
jgi:hypothetical protein